MAEFGIDLSDFNGFDFSNLDLSGSYNPFVDTTAAPSYSPSSFSSSGPDLTSYIEKLRQGTTVSDVDTVGQDYQQVLNETLADQGFVNTDYAEGGGFYDVADLKPTVNSVSVSDYKPRELGSFQGNLKGHTSSSLAQIKEFQNKLEPIMAPIMANLQVVNKLDYKDALEQAYSKNPEIQNLYKEYNVQPFRATEDGSVYLYDPFTFGELRTIEIPNRDLNKVLKAVTQIGVGFITGGAVSGMALGTVANAAAQAAMAGASSTAFGGSKESILNAVLMAGGMSLLTSAAENVRRGVADVAQETLNKVAPDIVTTVRIPPADVVKSSLAKIADGTTQLVRDTSGAIQEVLVTAPRLYGPSLTSIMDGISNVIGASALFDMSDGEVVDYLRNNNQLDEADQVESALDNRTPTEKTYDDLGPLYDKNGKQLRPTLNQDPSQLRTDTGIEYYNAKTGEVIFPDRGRLTNEARIAMEAEGIKVSTIADLSSGVDEGTIIRVQRFADRDPIITSLLDPPRPTLESIRRNSGGGGGGGGAPSSSAPSAPAPDSFELVNPANPSAPSTTVSFNMSSPVIPAAATSTAASMAAATAAAAAAEFSDINTDSTLDAITPDPASEVAVTVPRSTVNVQDFRTDREEITASNYDNSTEALRDQLIGLNPYSRKAKAIREMLRKRTEAAMQAANEARIEQANAKAAADAANAAEAAQNAADARDAAAAAGQARADAQAAADAQAGQGTANDGTSDTASNNTGNGSGGSGGGGNGNGGEGDGGQGGGARGMFAGAGGAGKPSVTDLVFSDYVKRYEAPALQQRVLPLQGYQAPQGLFRGLV